MEKIKQKQIPPGFTMGWFNVKSFFTSIALTEITDILDRVYNLKEIWTVSTKDEMNKLLTLYTKNVHFTLSIEIYGDGVAMNYPLGPILADVFLVERENTLVPRLHKNVKKQMLCRWYLYLCQKWIFRLSVNNTQLVSP